MHLIYSLCSECKALWSVSVLDWLLLGQLLRKQIRREGWLHCDSAGLLRGHDAHLFAFEVGEGLRLELPFELLLLVLELQLLLFEVARLLVQPLGGQLESYWDCQLPRTRNWLEYISREVWHFSCSDACKFLLVERRRRFPFSEGSA